MLQEHHHHPQHLRPSKTIMDGKRMDPPRIQPPKQKLGLNQTRKTSNNHHPRKTKPRKILPSHGINNPLPLPREQKMQITQEKNQQEHHPRSQPNKTKNTLKHQTNHMPKPPLLLQ